LSEEKTSCDVLIRNDMQWERFEVFDAEDTKVSLGVFTDVQDLLAAIDSNGWNIL